MRTCSVCRNPYSYCPHCSEDKLKPTWYFSFCGENCKDIYDITAKYENGHRPLPIDRLRDLCLYYHVSADYILGLPEDLPYGHSKTKRK